MKTSFFITLISLFQCCHAQPQPGAKLEANKNNNTLLWEISGKDLKKPSFLFGTFHLMCKEDIHFSSGLMAALKDSKEVYFEMDLDDPANTLGALFFMNMKNGVSLKDLYTEAEYKKLQTFFTDSLKVSLALMHKMKPSFLEAFLYPKMMPCKNMSGVEQELLKIAATEKKEIKGFETIAFQASVFDSIPYSEQAKSLYNTIDSLNNYRMYLDTMMLVYQSQQLDRIESLFSKPEFGLKDGLEILLDRRNINWVAQLKNILPEKNVFIAVGAGHLVGKKGLIALLKKEGYTLRPLKNMDE